MAAQPMDIRMAKLEGAYDQIDRRLGTLESQVISLRTTMESQFDQIRNTSDRHFLWLVGIVMTSWVTTILTVLIRH